MVLKLYILDYFVWAVLFLSSNSQAVSDNDLQNESPDLKSLRQSESMNISGEDLVARVRGKHERGPTRSEAYFSGLLICGSHLHITHSSN